jgi:hypothetical protein
LAGAKPDDDAFLDPVVYHPAICGRGGGADLTGGQHPTEFLYHAGGLAR